MRSPYTVAFTPEEWDRFSRPVNGQGGAQGLLRTLHTCAVGCDQLIVDTELLEKTYRYAYRYTTHGGFQGRFRAVVKAALRAGWQPAPRVILKATDAPRVEEAA